MIKHSYQLHAYFNDENEVFPFQYIGFIITIFSCIRLAKFNIDTRQNNSFIGVPTPANTILICSLPLINEYQPTFLGFNTSPLILNFYFLIGLTIIMSSLLIAEIPLFALKFKNFGLKENKIKYIFLIISIFMLVFFRFLSIPFLILFYVGLSIINNRRTGREK
jgi:CDP-diacylglycerol--serine O-phosphatidyltransferase